MARLVLINLGLHGHINPTLAMVRELVARGETVSYFAPEEFAPLIRATGATFFPYRSIFSQPVPEHVDSTGKTPMPIRLITDCLQVIPQLKDAVATQNPDAVLYDVMCLPGRILAEMLGKPAVRLSSTFVLNDKISWKPKAAGNQTVLDVTGAGIASLCNDYGVKPFHFQDIFTSPSELNIIYTVRNLQPSEETFDSRFVFVGACIDEPDNTDAIEKNDLPLVYVALGTLANNRPDFFSMCGEALTAGSAKKVLMAVGGQVNISRLGPFPSEVEVVRHASQLQVLRKAEVFVSHGGMNSLMEAIYFGVPLVLFPQTEEQILNAKRLSSLGAGIVLDDKQLSAKAIEQAVETVLTDHSYRKNMEILREQSRKAGGFRRAADSVQAFVSTRR